MAAASEGGILKFTVSAYTFNALLHFCLVSAIIVVLSVWLTDWLLMMREGRWWRCRDVFSLPVDKTTEKRDR